MIKGKPVGGDNSSRCLLACLLGREAALILEALLCCPRLHFAMDHTLTNNASFSCFEYFIGDICTISVSAVGAVMVLLLCVVLLIVAMVCVRRRRRRRRRREGEVEKEKEKEEEEEEEVGRDKPLTPDCKTSAEYVNPHFHSSLCKLCDTAKS